MNIGYTFIYGTRPEIIKIKTVIERLETSEFKNFNIIYTGQQFENALDFGKSINLHPDHIINLSNEDFSLINIFQEILKGLSEIESRIYNTVIVQGDTLSAVAAGLFTKFTRRRLIHIESGLRSYNKNEPFPEEINRLVIDHISDVHIAPTQDAMKNLIAEGIPKKEIYHFGQTGVDKLVSMISKNDKPEIANLAKSYKESKKEHNKKILVTLHRKENFNNIPQISKMINRILSIENNYKVIFILHSNPNISKEQQKYLVANDNLKIIYPQKYYEMLNMIIESDFILTDSGGIQEECAILNKPIFVLRNSTERPEILNKQSRIVKSNFMHNLESNVLNFLTSADLPESFNFDLIHQYGDGVAGLSIANFLIQEFNEKK